jgi:nitroreductase
MFVKIMEAIDAIMTRRSVRKFEKRQIPSPILEKIIEAGTYTPSALPFTVGFCRDAGPGIPEQGLGLLQACHDLADERFP